MKTSDSLTASLRVLRFGNFSAHCCHHRTLTGDKQTGNPITPVTDFFPAKFFYASSSKKSFPLNIAEARQAGLFLNVTDL